MEKRRRVMDPTAKRAAIIAAGERSFSAHGYTSTSMADIAKEAKVAVGTVYRLFPDKPSLLAALHKNIEDEFIVSMEKGWKASDDFTEKFGTMIDAIFDQAFAVRKTLPLYTLTRDMVGMTNFEPGAKMISAIESLYSEGVELGYFRFFPKGVQATIGHAMIEGGLRAWMNDPTLERRAEVTLTLKFLFKRAFLKTMPIE